MKQTLYTYNGKIIDLYDGDTFTALIDLGFKIFHETKLRLARVDTPELRGKEREEGLKVKEAVKEKILYKDVVITTYKDFKGKYGRYIAEVFIDGENLSDWLLANGMAKEYGK